MTPLRADSATIAGARPRHSTPAWHVAAAMIFGAVCLWLLTANIIFGDEGFFLVTYDLFLRAPERVARASASFWLTDVIGALWLQVAPMPGIIAIRVAALAADIAAAVIAWSVSRHFASRAGVWPALLAVGLALASGYIYLEYTVLTALVLTAACALMLRGVRRGGTTTWAAAGAMLGLGVFLRLPNVLLPSLVVAPMALAALERRALKPALRQTGGLALGLAAGLGAGAGLILVFHGSSDIAGGISDLLRPAASAHAPNRLLRDVARTVVVSGVHGAACWAIAIVAAASSARLGGGRMVAATIAVLALVAAHVLVPGVDWRYSVLGLVSIALVIALLRPAFGIEVRRTAFLAAWGLVLLGAGSASLPWPLLAGLWLALPVAFAVFAEGGAALRASLVAVILVGVLPITPYLTALRGVRPALWPHQLDVIPHDARLRPLHTSEAMAAAADSLLAALPRFVHPGDSIITTNGTPLVTYLAQARPFYGHPYIDIAGLARFEGYEAGADWRDPWPAWVRAKYMPTADFAITHTPGSTFADTRETREAVAILLEGRGYTKAWENELFEIWMPPREHAPRPEAR